MTRLRTPICIALASCTYPEPADVCPPPSDVFQLAAVHPSTANRGDTISLEGTFSESTIVRFPGGADSQASVLPGGHRATVVVPPNAGTGELFVKTGPDCVGPVAFRGASPGSELEMFRETRPLAITRSTPTTFVAQDSVYLVGGLSRHDLENTIERVQLNADCSIAQVSVVGVRLNAARSQHSTAVVGEWLYVLGGVIKNEGIVATNTIERARITDGGLGSFTFAGPLNVERYGHSSVVIGNKLYVLGGSDNSVESAEIMPGGDLGPFSKMDVSVLVEPKECRARLGATSLVLGDSLYILGGFYRDRENRDGDTLNTVDQATIDARNATIGEFITTTLSLGEQRALPASLAVGGYLYLFGGFDIEGPGIYRYFNSVERARITNGTSLGTFDAADSMGIARSGAASAVVGNCVCILGGFKDKDYLDNVECAAISAR